MKDRAEMPVYLVRRILPCIRCDGSNVIHGRTQVLGDYAIMCLRCTSFKKVDISVFCVELAHKELLALWNTSQTELTGYVSRYV